VQTVLHLLLVRRTLPLPEMLAPPRKTPARQLPRAGVLVRLSISRAVFASSNHRFLIMGGVVPVMFATWLV